MSTNFNEFDILFHNFFYPTSGYGSAATTKQPHPLNIFYDDAGLHFEVACTGLTKDDVKLDIEHDILKISYDKPEEEKEEHMDEARFKKGTDIGKKGPGFAKIEKVAAKKYGSEEAGKKVAGAILKKVVKK